LSVSPVVGKGNLREEGGHVTVNRTKEKNKIHSITIE
jgi:hypothetical protein